MPTDEFQAPGTARRLDDEFRGLLDELSKMAGTPIFFGNDESLTLHKLPLGIAPVDKVIGGGLAYNRITEIYGEFSAGKTVLALYAIRAAQELGLTALYIDVERAWNTEWATSLGVDVTKLAVAQPTDGPSVFDLAAGAAKRGVGVIVIDSLAAIPARDEFNTDKEGEQFDRSPVGKHAQLINQGMRALTVQNHSSVIILINQTREAVGVMYGNPEVLPGGKGHKFHAWQMLKVRRTGWTEEGTGADKHRIGYRMLIEVTKSKQNAPFGRAEVDFRFGEGINVTAGLIEAAIETGIIGRKGAHYTINEHKFFGKRALVEAISADPELLQLVQDTLDAIEVVTEL